MRRFLLVTLGLLVAGALLILVYTWLTPRLELFTPASEDGPQPAAAPLEFVFSRRMQPDSVTVRLRTDPPRSGQFTWESGRRLTFTPNQPWPSGGTVTVTLEAGAQTTGPLRLTLRQAVSWSFSVAPSRLAYLFPYAEAANVFSLDLQNGESRQLTHAPGQVLDYDVDRGGAALFYNADQGGGGSTLYRLDLLANTESVLLVCSGALCRYPQISPDGGWLAYERIPLGGPGPANRPQVWLLALTPDGLPAGEPALVANSQHSTQQPQWSPDGLLSYYDSTRQAFVIQDPAGYEHAAFPSLTGIAGDWDAGGASYLIPEIFSNAVSVGEGDLEPLPSSRLLRFYLDGRREDLTGTDSLEDASPAFSPDGRWLVFGRKYLDISRWTPGRQLWLVDLRANTAQAVTQAGQYHHYDFVWSPSGARLAFARFNKNILTEPPEIWLYAPDDGEPLEVISGGYSPQWIP